MMRLNSAFFGLHKRYIEDLCVRWGCFRGRFILVWAVRVRNIIGKRTYAPPQKSYVKYTKNRYYLPIKTYVHFLNIAIIN